MTEHCCELMDLYQKEDDVPILFVPKFREYGIAVLNGGSGFLQIDFCPWCGTRLPETLRNRWFIRLEAEGVDPDVDELPVRYRSDEWWKQRDN